MNAKNKKYGNRSPKSVLPANGSKVCFDKMGQSICSIQLCKNVRKKIRADLFSLKTQNQHTAKSPGQNNREDIDFPFPLGEDPI